MTSGLGPSTREHHLDAKNRNQLPERPAAPRVRAGIRNQLPERPAAPRVGAGIRNQLPERPAAPRVGSARDLPTRTETEALRSLAGKRPEKLRNESSLPPITILTIRFGRRDGHVERDLARRVPRLRRRLAANGG